MSDLDPIEIEIAINSPEALQQAAQVEGALNKLDNKVDVTEQRFKKYIASKLQENGVSVESIRLKETEVKQLQRYYTSISSLKELMGKATDPTQIGVYTYKLSELQKKIDTLVTKGAAQRISGTNETIVNQGTKLKTTKRQWDGLGNSINQLSREMPAFAVSAQTGILAISNNIPILADEINRLRLKNQELVASGGKGVPIWKQLTKSLFSWNTLLSVGVTLLTVYGKEIFNFLKKLTKGKNTFDQVKSRLKAFNDAFKSSPYKKARIEIAELTTVVNLAKKGKIDATVAIKKYNDSLGKAAGKVTTLEAAEKSLQKNADAYVRMTFYKAAAMAVLTQSQDEIIELSKKELLAEEKLTKSQNKEITEQNQVRRKRAEGRKKYREEDLKETIADAKKERTTLENETSKLSEFLLKKSADIANKFNLNLFQDTGNKESTSKEYERLLAKLADLDAEYSRKQLTDDEAELQALRDKFDKIRKLVEDFNADPKNKAQVISLNGLDNLQNKAEESLTFRQGTSKLKEQLDEEKVLFAAYEAFKTQVGEEEAEARYSKLTKGFRSYAELLKNEQQKLQEELSTKEPNEVTGAERERLILLEKQIKDFQVNQNKQLEERFSEAYNSVISQQQALLEIEDNYNNRKLEINEITNLEIRKEKLAELEFQRKASIDAVNTEAYNKTQIYEKLSADLIGITKRELANRIKALEEYLKVADDNLTEDQKAFLKAEIEKAKSITGNTSLQVRQKSLLREKEILLKRINQLQKKGNANVAEETKRLEELNEQLSENLSNQLANISDVANEIGGAFSELGSAIAYFDEGVGDTLGSMGDLTNIIGDAASAGASFASGDILGGITGVVSAIGGLFSLGAAARESERKSREEIAQWQAEILNSQLAYNAELRDRITSEIQLNDLYKSRVENIKEEIAANKEKFASIIADQQLAFNDLLNAQTVVDKKTEKYGGFLGIGRKTRVKDIKKTVAELLGAGEYITKEIELGLLTKTITVFEPGTLELTDEIFEKLEKLNSQTPLTDDALAAFEQLQALRDEYGSLEEAQRQLEIQLKDTVTATTAQTLADSIKEGIAAGKKSFSDFADDIEGFLRDAIIQGMSTKIIEPQMQELQDLLYGFLGDDILTEEERQQFQEMYLKIAEEAAQYVDLINETGISAIGATSTANSLEGAIQGASAEQIDVLSGQMGGFRIAQLETNQLLKVNHASQLEALSRHTEIQIDIEKNTKITATNSEYLKTIDESLKKITNDNSASANGL